VILTRYEIDGLTTPITLCPLGDLQWNGRESDITYGALQAHIAQCLELPNPVFVGMGDYVDFMSPSNRMAFTRAGLYDNAVERVEDSALELTFDVYNRILKPTTGKWLGLLSGHHFFQYNSGDNSDMRLASMLKTTYLGMCSMIRLYFKGKKSPNGVSAPSQHIDIWAHHGCGNGAKAGYPTYKLESVCNYFDADVFLMGHTTKKAYAPISRIYPIFSGTTEPTLRHKAIHLVGTGGWQKGYRDRDNKGTYVERKLLSPVALGAPVIHIRPRVGHRGVRDAGWWDPGVSVEL
jgi:hypothetical protein